MSKLYVEDLLGYENKLKEFLISEFERRLPYDNSYYNGKEKRLEKLNNDEFIFLNFIISFDRVKECKIAFTYEHGFGLYGDIFCNVKNDYGFIKMMRDFEQVYIFLKDIIIKNTHINIIESEEADIYFKRCLLLIELREEIEEITSLPTYILGWGEKLYVEIPKVDLEITISLEDTKMLSSSRPNTFAKNLTLPFDKNKESKVLKESYLKLLSISSLQENYELQQLYTHKENELSKEKYFNLYIWHELYEQFSKMGTNNGKMINYAEKFLNAKDDTDLYDIIFSSIETRLPMQLLDSPLESTEKALYADVVKTEYGVYYLKSDKRTIGFKSLSDIYKP